MLDARGVMRWYRAARRVLEGDDGEPLYFAVLQDTTSEHAARERADRSVRELDDWFDLSPVGMVLFDESGLLVRTNPAFDQMAGSVPVSLGEGDPGLARLLAWGEGGALATLKPGSRPIETQGWVGAAGTPLRRLRAIVRCYRTAGGERRYMGIVEDRSVEEERDLARMQIGAMMDTAGVGIATFEESSGWVRQQPADGSSLVVDAAEHPPRDRRARVAARVRAAAGGAQAHRARRGPLPRRPSRARPALAADAGRAGDARLGQEDRLGGHPRHHRPAGQPAPQRAAAARDDDHPREHDRRHRLPARRRPGALQPALRVDAAAAAERGRRLEPGRAAGAPSGGGIDGRRDPRCADRRRPLRDRVRLQRRRGGLARAATSTTAAAARAAACAGIRCRCGAPAARPASTRRSRCSPTSPA